MTPGTRSALAILIALLITLPAAFNASAVSAQDLDATAGKLDIGEIDGIQTAISRTYATDIGDIVDSANGSTPEPSETGGPILMLALVAKFDSDDHASDAASTVRDRLTDQQADDPNSIGMEATDINDLGDAAWAVTGTSESGESSVSIDGFVVQDGEWLYLSIAISDDDSSNDAARRLVEYALQHRENTDEVIYDHTGLSHGGIWSKLPPEGDTMSLSGTQPIFDNQLVPPTEPES